MTKEVACALLVLVLAGVGTEAHAFCGFYVAKADTALFNRASKVVLVRDGDRTVMTMANDFKGDPTEFAVVVPVPTFIRRDQIKVAERALLDHVDAYTSPRLVEYFDDNPCDVRKLERYRFMDGLMRSAVPAPPPARRDGLGVTVEAEYTVGEYDIVILSAQQSDGLVTWLGEAGYRIPTGAAGVLGSYIKQRMRFFVAKVNLDEETKLGYSYLRPLQIAYESPKFMLPIRLGTVNADGPQELFVFGLSRRGRIETTNYRNVRLPTGMELPPLVKQEFSGFYRAMFSDQVRREDMRTVFLEYAWDMNWCDPCAADPLTDDELRQLGVFWTADRGRDAGSRGQGVPSEVFVTRLHVRYDSAHFPEDLVFQQTNDRENFQGRYVIRHPWVGKDRCAAALEYRRELELRREEEIRRLASLTGWQVADIRRRMGLPPAEPQRGGWLLELWR